MSSAFFTHFFHYNLMVIMKQINKVFNYIYSKAIGNTLGYFILFLFFLTVSDIYFFITNNFYKYAIIYFIVSFFVASTICFILSHTFFLKKLLSAVLIFVLSIYSIINFYSILLFKTIVNNKCLELIMSTNIDEAIEFIQTYVKTFHLLIFSFFFILFVFIIRYKFRARKNFIYLYITILSISIIFTLKYPLTLHETPFGRIKTIMTKNFNLVPNLSLFLTEPSLQETSERHPENVVIILGEAFAKKHSSLYGYSLKTNPLLSNYGDELILFKNVTSPASHTTESFKAIMSTFSYTRSKDAWFFNTTIPEVANIMNYRTIWISNQKRFGLFNNVPSSFSQLCDTFVFVNECISSNDCYDEELLPYVMKEEREGKKDIFFLHLMGQHHKYSLRYPLHFDFFKEDDYLDIPQHQRQNVATYDNATLYNDYVVDSIIKIFKDKESLIFYIPDHGEDIYDTDEEYCGHGITAVSESDSVGRDIPFIIYTSPVFQKNFPDKVKRIKKAVECSFCTEDFIYTLMDIIGYKFKDNNDVEKYSLFKNF